MIDRYKTNQEKYKEIIDYIENHPNMLEELKKDILSIIGKYRVLIFCLEQQEICDLVDECIKAGNKKVLEKELHSMISGKVVDHDVSVYQERRGNKIHENIYNLD